MCRSGHRHTVVHLAYMLFLMEQKCQRANWHESGAANLVMFFLFFYASAQRGVFINIPRFDAVSWVKEEHLACTKNLPQQSQVFCLVEPPLPGLILEK